MKKHIIKEDSKGILTVTLNRLDKKNAITPSMYQELIDCFIYASQSEHIRCLLIKGSIDCFSAGNDFTEPAGSEPLAFKFIEILAEFDKPIVAAVAGATVGIGVTMLLHCDMVIASTGTKFRMPFANLGVSPEGASSALLANAVGPKVANELLLTGRFFSAEEASLWGLVNQVSEKGEALAVAQGTAKQLLKQPLPSLIATKAELRKYLPYNVSNVVEEELKTFVSLLESKETQARINAMVNR